ncbi:aminomethyl-transferring glycine dehydrogenase subunit GcvPA [Geothermobacter hydrogeniphilus]|uniref:Probable glycine dehydrogenase (decarboxylating) subunit 1 n=1 Tax=Geothermobacter hydrogeniphilus TaxID=1969733 RepID=A0A1X0XW76_9BACT|nr:aminomethyl-transferring glycine dehydrogenase subunit GcvPA [Geothermobacter hydrogeniphilus]ORJ57134.1 glycine dehydrogenase (aminomethyl-transferring) [Geothermobacter hydrogeniphilus]
MRYIPHTDDDVRQMLATIGVDSVTDLFVEVPEAVRLDRPLELPEPMSESQVLAEMKRLAAQNATTETHTIFLGGGAYNHFIPTVIDQLISRSEFYTAYTPYQPEISQGTLQAIYEYQTLICQLTGMDVSNASMYDGASACAEAVLMAARATRRKKMLLAASLHPEYRETVATYCRHLDIELLDLPYLPSGRIDQAALATLLDTETAAVVAGYPNFFGVIEELAPLAAAAHQVGALLVTAVAEPVALGQIKSPGELGADIVVGEGQSFGMPVSYGGPGVGFFAARQKTVRSMPGRLVGATRDKDGRTGYVLTLATREQHIRREKATSNICSNQGLCVLMATIYLSLLGRRGLREVAAQNLAKAEYAKQAIGALPGFSIPFSGPTFNEFVVEVPGDIDVLLLKLEQQQILAGLPLKRYDATMEQRLLICVTEQNSREQIDILVEALKGAAA